MVNVWADMTCHHERWRCGEWLRHWVQSSVFWPPGPHSAWWHISPPWLFSSSFTKGEINRQGSFFQLQKCRFHPSNSVVLYQQAQKVRQIYSAAFTFQNGTKYLLLYMAWVGGKERRGSILIYIRAIPHGTESTCACWKHSTTPSLGSPTQVDGFSSTIADDAET